MNLHHPQLENMATELHEFAQDVFQNRSHGQGRLVVLHGSNGCGKSMATKSFTRWFNAARMSIGPVMVPAYADVEAQTKIADCVYRAWPGVVDGFQKQNWLITDQLAAEYVAVIDDIGAEHDPSGIGLEKLYLILNQREFKHTLITTNFGPEHWESKFERRIASRLFRNSTHVDLGQVPDYSTI